MRKETTETVGTTEITEKFIIILMILCFAVVSFVSFVSVVSVVSVVSKKKLPKQHDPISQEKAADTTLGKNPDDGLYLGVLLIVGTFC
ncbi:MAG: hypothetical protein IKJ08_01620 [Alistipes sp.]|nr:hypothetical protein [Alistipes sp.]